MFEALALSWPIAVLGLVLVAAGAFTLRVPGHPAEDEQPVPAARA